MMAANLFESNYPPTGLIIWEIGLVRKVISMGVDFATNVCLFLLKIIFLWNIAEEFEKYF